MDKYFGEDIVEKIRESSLKFESLKNEINKIIVGQENIIDFAFMAILCNGHILLEGVPGIAKTTLIKAISKALGLKFNRIQFTPDLLPADLIGTLIFNPKNNEFETKKGPIFANLILADEINRAPAKVQSALLEAMQEHQVTIGNTTYILEEPFLVFATQNPIEQEGTYKLPEAQVDRFMFKILMSYPRKEEEKEIVYKSTKKLEVQQVLNKEEIFEAQELVNSIYIDDKIIDYIINIISATRKPSNFGLQKLSDYIKYGTSPRATLALYQASKARAFLRKRKFVIPDDVKITAFAALRHRILLTYDAEADNLTADNIIQQILDTIPSP